MGTSTEMRSRFSPLQRVSLGKLRFSTAKEAAATQTIGKFLDEVTERYQYRDSLVLRKPSQRMTYIELHTHITAVAAGLRDGRLFPGKKLAWLSDNKDCTVMGALGAGKGGYVVSFIDPEIDYETELHPILEKISPRGLCFSRWHPATGKDNHPKIMELVPELSRGITNNFPLRSRSYPDLKVVAHDDVRTSCEGCHLFANLPFYGPLGVELLEKHPFKASSVALEDYSAAADRSGKEWTHAELLEKASKLAKELDLKVGDRLAIDFPITSAFGYSLMLACLQSGTTMVLQASPTNAEEMSRTLSDEYCTIYCATPARMRDTMNHKLLSKLPREKLRKVVLVSDSEDAALKSSAEQSFAVPVSRIGM